MNLQPPVPFLQQATIMIAHARGAGHTPVCWHMNANTARVVAVELYEAEDRRRSALGRVIHRFRGRSTPARLESLCAMPVLEKADLSDGVIVLQHSGAVRPVPMAGTMGEAAQHLWPPKPEAPADPKAPMAEFQRREKISAEEAANKDKPALEDFVSTSERVTPTDVLITAMSDIDRIKRVVVIRVYDNDEVDMSLNTSALETVGILEKARVWLMMRG